MSEELKRPTPTVNQATANMENIEGTLPDGTKLSGVRFTDEQGRDRVQFTEEGVIFDAVKVGEPNEFTYELVEPVDPVKPE